MPDLYDTDYLADINWYNDEMVIDATLTEQFTEQISLDVPSDIKLTKGKYKFTISNPATADINFVRQDGYIQVLDENNNLVNKKYAVYGLIVDIQKNKMYAYVDIIDNPIPIAVIWGAVAVAVLIAGALAVDSILESVEKLIDASVSGLKDIFENMSSNPFTWSILIIVAGVLLLPYFLSKK